MNDTSIFINSPQPFPFLSVCHYINSIGWLLLRHDSRSSDAQGQSIVNLNALFHLLNTAKNEMKVKRLLLRKILDGTDLYGGKKNETLDEPYVNDTFQYIISGTLFAQYGGTIGYLARIISMANDLRLSSLKNDVFEDLSNKIVSVDCSMKNKNFRKEIFHDDSGSKEDESHEKDGDPNENEDSEQEHDKLTSLAVRKIIQDYIWIIFPEPEEDTSIFDVNYIYAMAGLSIVRSIKEDPSNYTFNDYILLSNSMEMNAQENASIQSVLEFFSAPALFFYANSEKEKFKHHNLTDKIFWSDAYRMFFTYLNKTVQEVSEKVFSECIYYKYEMEFDKIITRTQMAEKYLINYCKLSRSAEHFDFYVSNYKNIYEPKRLPCQDMHDLQKDYKDQFKPLRDIYFKLQKEYIYQALADGGLIAKLDAPDTFVHYVEFVNYRSGLPSGHKLYLPNPKPEIYTVFAIKKNAVEEYFALKNKPNGLSLLVHKGDEENFYNMMNYPGQRPEAIIKRVPLKTDYQNYSAFIERVANKKADEHEQQLYNSYYNATLGEKVIGVILSLVPFYTCVESIISGNVGEGLFSCTFDVIGLIPFVGVAVKYSTLITTRLAIGLENVAVKTVVQAGTRLGRLTQILSAASETVITKAFFKDLFIATLRVVDPGFELLTGLGKFSLKQLKKLVSSQFWKGKLYASLKKFKRVVMKINKLDVGLKMSAEKFVGNPVGRYTYPQGQHFFGPKCLKIDNNVAELRSLANAPYSTYVVPVKGNKNSILYRPVDFEHEELCNLFFELDDDDLLRPLLDEHVEVKMIPKGVEDDVQTITVIVHQEPEVGNLAGVEDLNHLKNNVKDNIVTRPESVVDPVDAASTDLEKFLKGDILLASEDIEYSVPTSSEVIRNSHDNDFIIQDTFEQRTGPKFSIDNRGRKRKIKPKKHRNGGERVPAPVPVPEEKHFTANDAAEYIAKELGKNPEEFKSILEKYQLSLMEEHRFLLTYQDFAKDYVLHKIVLPKYDVYKLKRIPVFEPWIISEPIKSYTSKPDFKNIKMMLKNIAGENFQIKYGVSLETAEHLYKFESNPNIDFFDFCIILALKMKGWQVIKQNKLMMKQTQIALNKLILRQINDAKMLEPVELCFKEIRKSEDTVDLLRNIESKTFSFNDITILKEFDLDIPNIKSASLETEVIYRIKLDNQFGVLDLNYVHENFIGEYIVYPHVYFTVTETQKLNKHVLVINMKKNILLKDDWKLSRIRKLEFLYDNQESLPIGQSILKDAETVAAGVPLSIERMAFKKLFSPVEVEDDIRELKMIVHEGRKSNVEDNIPTSSKRIAEVDESILTNARKLKVLDNGAVPKNQADQTAEEIRRRIEYDLSMQGTSKQRKGLEVSLGEDVRNTNNKKLEERNSPKQFVTFSRENKAFTIANAEEYITREKNIDILHAKEIVRNYLLSSLEKDHLMLTYQDFAKDYVLYGSVLKKYIPFRVKHVSHITASINKENKIVQAINTNFLEVSNSIRELYGLDVEKIYRVDFVNAEKMYNMIVYPKLGFLDFWHILAFIENKLAVIKKNDVMLKQTRIALSSVILRTINDAGMVKSVEVSFVESRSNQKTIDFLKHLEQKTFSFNDITLVKKFDLQKFESLKIEKTLPLVTNVIYKIELDNLFGVLDLGYVHPAFENKYIVYPELQFTVTKAEKVNENLLVLNLKQHLILKNEWKHANMRKLDFWFGKEQRSPTGELDIFLENNRLTARGQSIKKAAQMVSRRLPLITEKMAIEKLKGYLLNTDESSFYFTSYHSLARFWERDLKIPNFYQPYKFKNNKFTDDLLLKRQLNDKRDVNLMYNKIKIKYAPYEPSSKLLKELHDKYVSLAILGRDVKFDDYVALCFYENNLIPRNDDLLRRRNIAIINVALRQSQKSLAKESIILFLVSDFQVAPSKIKEAMQKGTSFQWNDFIEFSSSLSEERPKISQGVDSSDKILFILHLRDRYGLANLGHVLPSKLGKHVIYPSMRFIVNEITRVNEKGVKFMTVQIHDLQPVKKSKVFELVEEYDKLDIPDDGF